MNSIERDQFALLDQTLAIRDQMLDSLTDADLAKSFGGTTMTLGALLREFGEHEHIYAQGFRTFKHDWSYKTDDVSMETSVEKLRTWFKALDEQLKASLAALPEEAILGQTIDRGGFNPPVMVNFHVFREAVLIFGGKASIYLRSLNKPFADQVRDWIG